MLIFQDDWSIKRFELSFLSRRQPMFWADAMLGVVEQEQQSVLDLVY